MPQFLPSLLLHICPVGTVVPVLWLESSIHNREELKKQKMVNGSPVMRAPGLPRLLGHLSPHNHEDSFLLQSLISLDPTMSPSVILPNPQCCPQNPSILSHLALCP